MNFDKQIEQFLIENKCVSLQGIGTFFISENTDEIKNENGIRFTYDSKAITSIELINTIALESKRMKSLVSADIDSYLNLIKQFLNIAKPYHFPGIGVLSKNNKGEYLFHEKNTYKSTLVNNKDENEFETTLIESKIKRKKIIVYSLMTIVIISIISGVGWGVYNWVGNSKPKNTHVSNKDSLQKNHQKPILINNSTTSIIKIDSITKKFVVGVIRYRSILFNELNELNRSGLVAYHDTAFIKDSLRYRLIIQHSYPQSDSLKVLDSLKLKFNFPVYSIN